MKLLGIAIAVVTFTGCTTSSIDTTRKSNLTVAAPNELGVYTIPVGAGNCQLMQCPTQNNDKVVLFDCGSRGRGNLGWTAEEVKDYVDDFIGEDTEIVVSVSHPDIDHYSYIPRIMEGHNISAIYLGGDYTHYSDAMDEWVQAQVQEGADFVDFNGDLYWSDAPEEALGCNGADAKILIVNAGATDNDNSMVVSVNYGLFQTVFTGDMTGATEAEITTHLGDTNVELNQTDFITGAHHGSTSHGSNSEDWVSDNSSGLVVFSAGTRDEHPWCTAVDEYLGFLYNSADHEYACGDGMWEDRDSSQGVFVTNNNGLLEVYGLDNGAYRWENTVEGADGLTSTIPNSSINTKMTASVE